MDYIYMCSYCTDSFSTLEGFHNHAKTKHNCIVCCSDCQGWFVTKDALFDHLAKTQHLSTTSCRLCKRLFKEESELKAHIKTALNHQERCGVAIQCRVCGTVFKQAADQSAHQAQTKHAAYHLCVLAKTPAKATEEPVLVPQPGSHAFTALTTEEQQRAAIALADNCHSASRLQKQGFYWVHDGGNRPPALPLAPPLSEFLAMHPAKPNGPKSKAIVIGCEMAGRQGLRKPARFCAIDFYTGQKIIDVDVSTGPNSTPANELRVRKKWKTARNVFLQQTDETTIVIGHTVHQTLRALRVSHAKVIDTAILTAEAVFGPDGVQHRQWSLRALCHELLDGPVPVEARTCPQNLLYTRELVLLYLWEPEKVWSWARQASQELLAVLGSQAETSRKRKRGPEPTPESGRRKGPGLGPYMPVRPSSAVQKPKAAYSSASSYYLPGDYVDDL